MNVKVRPFIPKGRKPRFRWGCCSVCDDKPPHNVIEKVFEIWIGWVVIWISWEVR